MNQAKTDGRQTAGSSDVLSWCTSKQLSTRYEEETKRLGEIKTEAYSGVHFYQDWTASTKAGAARESRLPDQLWALSWASVSLFSSFYAAILVGCQVGWMARDPRRIHRQRARRHQQTPARRQQTLARRAVRQRDGDFLRAADRVRVQSGRPRQSVRQHIRRCNAGAGTCYVSASLFGEPGYPDPGMPPSWEYRLVFDTFVRVDCLVFEAFVRVD